MLRLTAPSLVALPWEALFDSEIGANVCLESRYCATPPHLTPPIPVYFKSKPCRDELTRFLKHEKQLGRDDLILPIYFVEAPILERNDLLAKDPLASAIAKRPRYDFRVQADLALDDPERVRVVRDLAKQVAAAIARSTGFEVAADPADLDAEARAVVATAAIDGERAPDKSRRRVLWVDDRPGTTSSNAVRWRRTTSISYCPSRRRRRWPRPALDTMTRSSATWAGPQMLKQGIRCSKRFVAMVIRRRTSSMPGRRKPKHIREALKRGAQGTTNVGDGLLRMVLKVVDS